MLSNKRTNTHASDSDDKHSIHTQDNEINDHKVPMDVRPAQIGLRTNSVQGLDIAQLIRTWDVFPIFTC